MTREPQHDAVQRTDGRRVGVLLTGPTRRWRRRLASARNYARVASRFAPYTRNRRGSMTVALLLSLAFTLMRVLEPWPMKLIIDSVLLGAALPDALPAALAPSTGPRTLLLVLLVASIILVAFLRGLFYYWHRLRVARLGIEVTADLRFDLYRHIQHLSLSFHDRRRTGDLIVRLTSDIRMLRSAFVSLPLELIEGFLLMTGMAVVMLLMDWQLALLAIVMLPTVAVAVRRYQRPMRQAIRRQREREGNLASMATEALGAIRVVKGFRGEKAELKRFRGANRKDVRSGLKASRFEAKLRWSAELSISLITAVIVLLAVRRILAGVLSVGDMIVFLAYLRVYARPLRRASKIAERMIRASAAGERVLRILELES
ncbi:MAG: ABC transporter ATP-binding protein, partial [Acidobacteriota bacterium]|nr:ABC transporter ATP-binding protein [Acidobacteriota bacterium]